MDGHRVIAVEPLKINNIRLCVSLMAGGIYDKVILVNNALSDQHGTFVTMGKARGNIGASWILSNTSENTAQYVDAIATAKLDDVLNLPKRHIREAVVKMDVEGHEHRVLQGSKLFFDKVKVLMVLMEWRAHRNKVTGLNIINFFKERNFEPRDPLHINSSLSNIHYNQWPADVIWARLHQ